MSVRISLRWSSGSSAPRPATMRYRRCTRAARRSTRSSSARRCAATSACSTSAAARATPRSRWRAARAEVDRARPDGGDAGHRRRPRARARARERVVQARARRGAAVRGRLVRRRHLAPVRAPLRRRRAPRPARPRACCGRAGSTSWSTRTRPRIRCRTRILNAIEVLRDPSHVRNYSLSQWCAMFRDAGLSAEVGGRWPTRLGFDELDRAARHAGGARHRAARADRRGAVRGARRVRDRARDGLRLVDPDRARRGRR